jgi:hypothetical protein
LPACVGARIDHLDVVDVDAGGTRGVRDCVRCPQQYRSSDTLVLEPTGGSEDSGILTFGQNDLELATACYVETAIDWVHGHLNVRLKSANDPNEDIDD